MKNSFSDIGRINEGKFKKIDWFSDKKNVLLKIRWFILKDPPKSMKSYSVVD
jgi:hypothetical protein